MAEEKDKKNGNKQLEKKRSSTSFNSVSDSSDDENDIRLSAPIKKSSQGLADKDNLNNNKPKRSSTSIDIYKKQSELSKKNESETSYASKVLNISQQNTAVSNLSNKN